MIRNLFRRVFPVILLLSAGPLYADDGGREAPQPQYGPYYAGQLLVAERTMPDPRFAGTVIYLADHDAEGAFGLVVNRPIGKGPVLDFLIGLGKPPAPDEDISGDVRIHAGGPVEPGAGFVLHSNEYQTETTAMIRGKVAVTASLKAVKDIGLGEGPNRYLILLGYAGWGAGQLEAEMRRGDWSIAPFDDAVVFGADDADKWQRAQERAGLPM
ncbi:MAG: YqgE/AlgH family protein [Rhodospirillales bacterium]